MHGDDVPSDKLLPRDLRWLFIMRTQCGFCAIWGAPEALVVRSFPLMLVYTQLLAPFKCSYQFLLAPVASVPGGPVSAVTMDSLDSPLSPDFRVMF